MVYLKVKNVNHPCDNYCVTSEPSVTLSSSRTKQQSEIIHNTINPSVLQSSNPLLWFRNILENWTLSSFLQLSAVVEQKEVKFCAKEMNQKTCTANAVFVFAVCEKLALNEIQHHGLLMFCAAGSCFQFSTGPKNNKPPSKILAPTSLQQGRFTFGYQQALIQRIGCTFRGEETTAYFTQSISSNHHKHCLPQPQNNLFGVAFSGLSKSTSRTKLIAHLAFVCCPRNLLSQSLLPSNNSWCVHSKDSYRTKQLRKLWNCILVKDFHTALITFLCDFSFPWVKSCLSLPLSLLLMHK